MNKIKLNQNQNFSSWMFTSEYITLNSGDNGFLEMFWLFYI